MGEVVILSGVRTPIGRFQGTLAAVPAPRLGAAAIAEAVRRAGVAPAQVDEVYMGIILAAGIGQAPARQASIYGGLPNTVPATTVNKMCGSGLKAAMLGAQTIQGGDAEVVVAGGMENMSASPYLLDRARTGYRLGHGQLLDSMIRDGLWDAFTDQHMGNCCELLAREYRITREAQDEYAHRSYTRALEALDSGHFSRETVAVETGNGRAPKVVSEDEEPRRFQPEKIASLPPVFERDGTVTVANASSISDGGAALVLASADAARKVGAKPLARVVGQAVSARAPEWFTIAPAGAIQKLLAKTGWSADSVDFYEINEAYAAVVLAVAREVGLDLARVNVHGGAVALGHPVGASGARILVTLLNTMAERNAKRGVAAVCLGGGEAVALAVERT